MKTLSEFDIALAQRLNIITPSFLTHATPEFVNYWVEVQKEIKQRNTLHTAEDSHEHHR
ncbi:TPA: hypothetical protein ACOJQP_000083 [Vibrio harveyi]|uniref:hypothetical protein n=1 Tax=Vibrio harveyi TaxID=669 RepID=UPI00390C2BDD